MAAGLAVLTILGTGVLWLSFRLPARWHVSSDSESEWQQGDLSQNLAALAASSVSSPSPLPPRVVYPYSVVPGGIRAPEELREIIEHDDVVRRHYADFDFRNARIVELQQPELVYLSYRMGNRIFWTGHKVSLRKGEKVITDGKITARTRCANQISPVAVEAISPQEPPLEKFEQPFVMGESAIQLPFPEAVLPLGPQPPNPLPNGWFPPLFPPGIPIAVCPPTRKKEAGGVELAKTVPCTKPTTPPSPVPEPGTILLVASGMAGVYLCYRRQAFLRMKRIAARR